MTAPKPFAIRDNIRRYRSLPMEEFKSRLRWLYDHPGEWLWWSRARFTSSARQLRAPSFERRFVSPSLVNFEDHPLSAWKSGLWVRCVRGMYSDSTGYDRLGKE